MLARIAVRTAVWTSLGTYLNIAIGFVSTLVMTRILSPEVFGFFSMAIFWSSLINLRTKSGLHYAAIRQVKTDGTLLGTFLALDLIGAGASLTLSALVAIVMFGLGYPWPVIVGLMVLMAADSVSVVVSPLNMVLEKEVQISRLTLVTISASIGAYIVAISLAILRKDIWSLLAVNAVNTIVWAGGVYWVCERRLPQALRWKWKFDKSLAMQLMKQGLPTGLSLMALGSIVTQFDNFLIGTFVGYTTLGFYDRAYRIANWSNLLLSMVVSRIGFLTFAKVRRDLPRLTHAVRLSLWLITTLGIPITLVLVFGAADIVQILYGPRWSDSAYYLSFLTIYSLVWPVVNLGFWLSVALGHSRTTLYLTGVQAAAIVLIATPLTLRWGVSGTIAGVGITMVLAFCLSIYYVFRQVPLSIRASFAAPLVAACMAAALLFGLQHIGGWADWLSLARLAAIGIAGPGAFIMVLFALHPAEMIERVQYLVRLFPGARATN